MESWHHKAWIKGTPKEQFLRHRHNCFDKDIYIHQLKGLRQRVLEKYSSKIVKEVFYHALEQDLNYPMREKKGGKGVLLCILPYCDDK